MLKTTLSKLLLLGAVILVALTASGCSKQECVTQAQPEPEGVSFEWPEDWSFSDRAVSNLPIEQQITVASCVKLSAEANWSEGGPMYPKEVAEAFLLDFPYPDIGEYTTGSPGAKKRGAIAFLSQTTHNTQNWPGVYLREIWLYADEGTYQINLWLDEEGNIMGSSLAFSDGFSPFESIRCFTLISAPPTEVLKHQYNWLMKNPITHEKAVQILGGDPTGASFLRFNIISSCFKPLEKTYYLYDMLPSDPGKLSEVVQIWYRKDPFLQSLVIRQTSAESYLRIFSHEEEGISFHPHFVVHLEDGTPVGLRFSNQTLDGTPFTPGWIKHVWTAEWISRGIRHSIRGTNVDSHDLLRAVSDLSHQTVAPLP